MCGADSPAPHMHARDKTVVASWIGKNVCMFDLNLLRVLAAVIEQGTITAAADKLQMSQPAISQSINRLRKVIKDDLFVKDGRGITPTRVALQLYRDTSEHVHQAGLQRSGVSSPSISHYHRSLSHCLDRYRSAGVLATVEQVMRSMAPQAQLEVIGPNTESVAVQLKVASSIWLFYRRSLAMRFAQQSCTSATICALQRPGFLHLLGPVCRSSRVIPGCGHDFYRAHAHGKYLHRSLLVPSSSIPSPRFPAC